MAVQNGWFSGDIQHPLAVSAVSKIVSHVTQTFQDHGKQNPTKDKIGKTGQLLQCLYWVLKSSDPNRKQQKVLPVYVLCVKLGILSLHVVCMSINMCWQCSTCQTTMLTVGNICFFKKSDWILHLMTFFTVDFITLTFIFQKSDPKHWSAS